MSEHRKDTDRLRYAHPLAAQVARIEAEGRQQTTRRPKQRRRDR